MIALNKLEKNPVMNNNAAYFLIPIYYSNTNPNIRSVNKLIIAYKILPKSGIDTINLWTCPKFEKKYTLVLYFWSKFRPKCIKCTSI